MDSADKESKPNEENAESLFLKGKEKFEQNSFFEALDLFSQIISLDRNNGEVYFYRGKCHGELNNLKEAIEDYTQTIKLDSNHAKAYNNRGYSKMQLLQLSAALEDFTKAIELDNKDPKPFSNRGYCKYMLGDDKGAFTDYLEAIKRNPIYVINLLRCLAQSISINKYFATGFVIYFLIVWILGAGVLEHGSTRYLDYNFSEDLASVCKKNKCGFIDKKGETVIPFKYNLAYPFSGGLAPVMLNGKWGLINKKNKTVIPFMYDDMRPFKDDLATVKIKNKWGFINKKNEIIIAAKYDNAYPFKEGLAPVELNDKWGSINKKGKVVIPIKYKWSFGFSEGLANVKVNDRNGFIDKNSKTIIPFIYDYASNFSEGLAVVTLKDKSGFIDKKGKTIIPFKYDAISVSSFKDGLASVNLKDKAGVINNKGKIIIPFQYKSYELFCCSDGLAAAKKNDKWGFIDTNNKVVIPFIYEETTAFSKGLAAVQLNGKWGFINKKGETIIPFQYQSNRKVILSSTIEIPSILIKLFQPNGMAFSLIIIFFILLPFDFLNTFKKVPYLSALVNKNEMNYSKQSSVFFYTCYILLAIFSILNFLIPHLSNLHDVGYFIFFLVLIISANTYCACILLGITSALKGIGTASWDEKVIMGFQPDKYFCEDLFCGQKITLLWEEVRICRVKVPLQIQLEDTHGQCILLSAHTIGTADIIKEIIQRKNNIILEGSTWDKLQLVVDIAESKNERLTEPMYLVI